jgi:hypothetical protein
MMKRMLRIAKLALVVMAGVIAVLMLGAMILCLPPVQRLIVRRAEARVERVVREIAATGAPVSLSQLYKAPIPDAENAALVYQKAFAALQFPADDGTFAFDVASGKASLADAAVASRLRGIVHRNVEALRLIHQASVMPRCDFRLDWSKGVFLTFPQYPKLRNCSRLLALESGWLLHEGRVGAALEACAANLRLAHAADDPVIGGQLLRYAISAIACRSLGAVLQESAPPADACRSLAGEMARTDLRSSYIAALKGGRAMVLSVFDGVRSSPRPAKPSQQRAGGSKPTDQEPVRPQLNRSYFWRWVLACDELTYLGLVERAIAEAKLPYREAVRVRPSLEERTRHLSNVPPRIVTRLFMPVYRRAVIARDRAIAQLGLAEVALLLKAYHADHGSYPKSLAQLGRINGHSLPTDPFSGKPFVYRRAGAGFLIYSWGPNLKDDRGMPPPKDKRDEGDIVLRCTR